MEVNTNEKVQEAVENLTKAIVESVEPTEAPETQTNYYIQGVPFIVEMTFDRWSPEVESKLMKCFMRDEELLPGLKVTKLYKMSVSSETLALDNISEKLEGIKTAVDNYRSEIECVKKRYINKMAASK